MTILLTYNYTQNMNQKNSFYNKVPFHNKLSYSVADARNWKGKLLATDIVKTLTCIKAFTACNVSTET